MFQNISKISINIWIPFNYKNTGELCDKKQDTYNSGKVIAKKSFVLHEEVIDVLKLYIYIYPHNRNIVIFYLSFVRIMVQPFLLGKWRKKYLKLDKDYAGSFSKKSGI